MNAMRSWSERLEGVEHFDSLSEAELWHRLRQLRKAPTREAPLADAWGTPLAIHILAGGYEIRSAAADRVFDKTVFEGEATSRGQDLVFANGSFVQWPKGDISLPPAYDPRPKTPADPVVGQCSRCHGSRY
jgi:hypothetical protein